MTTYTHDNCAKNQNFDGEYMCGICLCDTNILLMIKAGMYIDMCKCVNIYHDKCLSQWFDSKSQIICPVCKQFFREIVKSDFIDKYVDTIW